jgi:transposase-like protein
MSAGKKKTATPRRSQTAASPTKSTPIRIWHPDIHDTSITSAEQLLCLITQDYPGLTRNPQFPQLLTDAQKHLTLITLLHNEHNLRRGDFTRLARAVGASRQRVTAWVQQARPPRLYYVIEHSLAKSDAHTKLARIHCDNDGIRSTGNVKRRLGAYYLTPLHKRSPEHERRLAQCEVYFRALQMLKDGGCYLDVARGLGVHHSQVSRWLDGHRPDLVDLACRIPNPSPGAGSKWLPLWMDQAFRPRDFVQVPTHIGNHIQIRKLLDQLKSLDNDRMAQLRKDLGPLNKEDALYYLLGLIVSDFEKNRPRTSSTELALNLSKKYSWSEQVGQAACYYFGQLGIYANKAKDRDSSAGPKTCHSWRSRKSPLITWITRTCLGLQEHECTTYYPVKADWILKAPSNLRKAFLQGLNDGDGYATIKGQSIGNACGPNVSFVKALLKTFNIQCTDDGQRVRIHSQEGIVRAAELPFFRYATGRQRNADKLADMMHARQQQRSTNMDSLEILEVMVQLRKEGLSYGEVAERLFDQFGVSLDHSTVALRINRRSRTAVQETV